MVIRKHFAPRNLHTQGPTEPFTLKGEVALVTGGATGIGRAIAAALTKQGST
jgi:hypothetical protein